MSWPSRPYYNANPFVGLSRHDSLITVPLPPFMVPAILPHIEFGVVQGLWIGSYLSTGYHRKVSSDGLLLLGRLSDAGIGIPHISIPPSWFNLLTSLFGSSNAIFGSSKVTFGSKNLLWGNSDSPAAATPFGRVPFSLNFGCNEPFLCPVDVVVLWGTVFVGMSLEDIWSGLETWAMYVAIELAGKAFGKLLGGGVGKLRQLVRRTATEAAEEAGGSVSKEVAETYAKKAARVQGMRDTLEMSEKELGEFAEQGGSRELGAAARNLDEGVEQAEHALESQLADIDAREIAEEAAMETEAELTRGIRLGAGLAEENVQDALKQSMLKDALAELDEAIAAMSKDVLQDYVLQGLFWGTLGVSLTHLLAYGKVLAGGTEGGVFSFEGARLPHRIKELWPEIVSGAEGAAGDVGSWFEHDVPDFFEHDAADWFEHDLPDGLATFGQRATPR